MQFNTLQSGLSNVLNGIFSVSGIKYEFEKLANNCIGCYFCKRQIDERCYTFVQLREHWDRDIIFIACNDQCHIAMNDCIVSKCQACQREYLHMRYDNDICINCIVCTDIES